MRGELYEICYPVRSPMMLYNCVVQQPFVIFGMGSKWPSFISGPNSFLLLDLVSEHFSIEKQNISVWCEESAHLSPVPVAGLSRTLSGLGRRRCWGNIHWLHATSTLSYLVPWTSCVEISAYVEEPSTGATSKQPYAMASLMGIVAL